MICEKIKIKCEEIDEISNHFCEMLNFIFVELDDDYGEHYNVLKNNIKNKIIENISTKKNTMIIKNDKIMIGDNSENLENLKNLYFIFQKNLENVKSCEQNIIDVNMYTDNKKKIFVNFNNNFFFETIEFSISNDSDNDVIIYFNFVFLFEEFKIQLKKKTAINAEIINNVLCVKDFKL